MVGRAGRAGQSASGESFLLGSGEAFSCAGEWRAICALLEAPMPCLTSQLLPCVAAAGAGGAADAGAGLGLHPTKCYLAFCVHCLYRNTLAQSARIWSIAVPMSEPKRNKSLKELKAP